MGNESEEIDVYGRLDVTVPESVYEAGKVSTVAILLRNPFNKPVEILEIQGPRSSHLSEVVRDFQTTTRDRASTASQKPRRPNWLDSFMRVLIAKVKVNEVSFGGITAEFPGSERSLNIKAEPNSDIEIDTDLSNYDSVNVLVEEGAKVRFSPQKDGPVLEERKTITIEPHCEAVAYFQISTVGWLFFTPTRRSLNTLVSYRIDGKTKTQVVTSEFDVRPPLLSMIIGSIVGALLGTLAKILNSAQIIEWQPLIVSLGASVVMSLISTIALSRKTGTQGFITVEDFFGGFVIGALIGYGGSSYFERALIPQTPNSPTTE